MHDQHQHPTHIITTYLGISSIVVSPDDDTVVLFGVYGNMIDGSMPVIELELSFQLMNDLLSSIPEQSEDAINKISDALTNPQDAPDFIDVSDNGGLHFEDHIFCLQAVVAEDQTLEEIDPEEIEYLLHGFINRKDLLPHFINSSIPTGIDYATYLYRVMSIRYNFYLHFKPMVDNETALVCSNLSDPLSFELSKSFYHLFNKQDKENY